MSLTHTGPRDSTSATAKGCDPKGEPPKRGVYDDGCRA
jgi:hypothetical protein